MYSNAVAWASVRQAGQRVVIARQDRDGFAADELENPDIARFEIGRVGRAKQRHETDHAAALIAKRARQNFVGSPRRGSVHDHGAVVEPDPCEEVLLRPIEQLRRLRRPFVTARILDVLVRYHERTGDAAELARAVANQLVQRARVLSVVLVDGQQQLETRATLGRTAALLAVE
jgi:hypothetical protein